MKPIDNKESIKINEYEHSMESSYHLTKRNKPITFYKVISKIIRFENTKRKNI